MLVLAPQRASAAASTGALFSPPKPQPPPMGRLTLVTALSRSAGCPAYQVTVRSLTALVRVLTAAITSRLVGRMTASFARQVSLMFSTSRSAPLRPSMTTQLARLVRSLSHSASQAIPRPVGLRSIREIRAGPSAGMTAPQRQTSAPSAVNLTPKAVLPYGFSCSLRQASQASAGMA